jgi:hypothetical protein
LYIGIVGHHHITAELNTIFAGPKTGGCNWPYVSSLDSLHMILVGLNPKKFRALPASLCSNKYPNRKVKSLRRLGACLETSALVIALK